MAENYEFGIDLFSGDAAKTGYRIGNLNNQDQRTYPAQYGSNRMVKGRLVDVIHGHLTPTGDPATLIISTFKFLGSTHANRFQYAKITWDFTYADQDSGESPEVVNLSLDDQYVMNQTTTATSTERSDDAGLQGGASDASANISTGWERSESADVQDHISVYGTSVFTQTYAGGPNGAQ